jgi:hypothetical protein
MLGDGNSELVYTLLLGSRVSTVTK